VSFKLDCIEALSAQYQLQHQLRICYGGCIQIILMVGGRNMLKLPQPNLAVSSAV